MQTRLQFSKIILLCIITLLITADFATAQINSEVSTTKRHKIGFVSGSGINMNRVGIAVNYNYKVTYFQLQYYYTLTQKRNWSLEVLAQPQYNVSQFDPKDDLSATVHGYEFGLNGGILLRKSFLDNALSLYGLVSAGPHYVSDMPDRQADGFIFSDNIMLGASIRLFKDVQLDIRSGFRHLSNANLKVPNGGINNFVLNAGFSIEL